MRRDLTYFWPMNLAVVGGVAVTTAVLTGALVVGDSMRWSLQQLTLARLGRIDHVLVGERFFAADLATRLTDQSELAGRTVDLVPAILLRSSVVHATSGSRASGVQIVGVDESFTRLYAEAAGGAQLPLKRLADQVFPSVSLNAPLAQELGAEVGDDILLSFGRPSDVPAATLLGRRDLADVSSTLRLTVTGIVPFSGPGRFGLEARQTRPLNVYLELSTLQRRLNREQQVNALLAAGHPSQSRAIDHAEEGLRILQRTLTTEDLGLRLRRGEGYLAVESRELVLRPEIVAAVERLAEQSGATAWPVLTYLANRMEVGDRLLPYSTVTALRTPVPTAFGGLATLSGQPVTEIGPGDVVLNTWAAGDLAARPGDDLRMTYYVVGPDDRLQTASADFRISAVVDLDGLAADAALTPTVPGISDAESIADWDPPFPVDLELIRPRDEDYWNEYRGTPKAFTSLAHGQRLWQSRYGAVTSIRLLPGARHGLERLRVTLEQELALEVSPESAGFRWLPVRERGLRGASGTTDFAGLFMGFSLFLIVAALLLVGLLFTLLVLQRAREVGLLLAVGHSLRGVRRRLLAEGAVLAVLGCSAGTGLALLYADLLLRGLDNWWLPVVDAPFLQLHWRPATLALGGASSVLLILATIARTVRRVSRVPARRLLAGSLETTRGPAPRRRAGRVAVLAFGVALVLLLAALFAGLESAPALFFALAASTVTGGIAGFSAWSQRTRRDGEVSGRPSLLAMAARNSAHNPGRSLLSVALVACASFVLVSVTANRKSPRADALARDSGTGGLALVAEADTPLPAPLASVSPTSAEALYFSFRVRPGDDASCLNLYQPEQPRLLGVPADFVERGGFRFRSTLDEVDNPWTLLRRSLADGAVPAIGDYNSVRWILHSGLGQELSMPDGRGRQVRLKIVALLETSVFQSELLISEESFLEHFPDHGGYGYFLAELPSDRSRATADVLERELAPFGFDAGSTVEKLSSYQAVENMYLATFEILGGLGLLLGTLGLGIVLLRNVLERRGELATLRAFGYRRSTLALLVVAENTLLLTIGLLIGGGAGLLAVAPHLLAGGIAVPWGSLIAMLAAVFAVGLAASSAAVVGSLRVALLPALKTD